MWASGTWRTSSVWRRSSSSPCRPRLLPGRRNPTERAMADPTPSPDTTPAPGTPAPAAAAQPPGPSTAPAAPVPSVLGSDAPEPAPTYGDFKLPEGAAIDGESLEVASTLFADSGLSQE